MRLLLLADTHVPRRARDLPTRVWDEVAQADVVLHAGDWVEPELLDRLTVTVAGLTVMEMFPPRLTVRFTVVE